MSDNAPRDRSYLAKTLTAAIRALLPAGLSVLTAAFIFPSGALDLIKAGLLLCGVFMTIELCFWAAGKEPELPRISIGYIARRSLIISTFVAAAFVGKLVWADQYFISGEALLAGQASEDLFERRAFLLQRVARSDFGPADIPGFIPSPFREELAIASLSMTATALTNMAYLYPDTRVEALQAIETMIEAMLTPAIRRYEVFWWGHDALESLENGRGQIGYLGHLNLMLGAYRLLGGDTRYDTLHTDISTALAKRIQESPGFHVETFPGARFTADNTLVLVSLAHYDRIHGEHFMPVVVDWLEYTQQHLLDPETGMVVYHVDEQGRAQGTPRGVLQAWNSMWLPHIDETFAKSQYTRMKTHLADSFALLSLGGIREYPVGKTGPSDMIAGPTIAGVSSAATGFAIGGARFQKDTEFLSKLLRTAEFVGSTIDFEGERYFLLSPLVGEAIVLACMTSTGWDARYIMETSKTKRRLLG